MGRKRGELPSIAELNADLDLQGYIVIDAEHRWLEKSYAKSGKQKYIYVRVMNIENGEKSKWMRKDVARNKWGKHTINKKHRQISKHTDETVAKQVQELTNENAELVKWWRGEGASSNMIYVQVKYNCGCIKEIQMHPTALTPDCPICSAKWKTEDAVCKIAEHYANTLYDKYMTMIPHRQHTVHMIIDGKEVTRRYDVAIEIVNKYDNSFNRWIFVEYNGEQHYRPVNFGNLDEDELMRQFRGNVERDKQKVVYCEEHNIPLIVIPYWKKDRIEEILKDKLVDAIFKETSESVIEYIDKYFFS